MDSDLLTTREAARLLGVGTTSIKRWADAGMLPCVRTPGGHRRYPRASVEALARGGGTDTGEGSTESRDDPWIRAWVTRLIDSGPYDELWEAFVAERRREGAWWRVAERFGAVLEEIGRRWATGHISVLEEHLASERLRRTITKAVEHMTLPRHAPRALLLVAPGDDHTLGLALAELCLREAGWSTEWVGRRTPVDAVIRYVERERVRLVAVSASEISTDGVALSVLAGHLGKVCADVGADLLLGGAGAWPEEPPHGARVHSFEDLPAAAC